MKENSEILKERLSAFNKISGPRVGDYVYMPSNDERVPEYTRITHIWPGPDRIQTGGHENSSYYLGGSLSYSGGLDGGIAPDDLISTDRTKSGQIWFFDKDISGAGRGVYFTAEMRIFAVKAGADISGLYHLKCPYDLCVLDAAQHARTCGYWYTITKNATSHTAFRTEEELTAWLKQNRLTLSAPLTPAGTSSYQKLSYAA